MMTQCDFPLARRKPRPICCVNTVSDSVGRANSNVSTEGISTPSLNKSTVKMTSSSPDSSRFRAWSLVLRSDFRVMQSFCSLPY